MLATDRDALICDIAETYQIYGLQGLPVSLLATLASGLRDNSRIKLKMAGALVPQETLLLSMAVDNLSFLSWTKTEAAQKGQGKPESITNALLGQNRKKNSGAEVFASGEDFMKRREELLGGDLSVE